MSVQMRTVEDGVTGDTPKTPLQSNFKKLTMALLFVDNPQCTTPPRDPNDFFATYPITFSTTNTARRKCKLLVSSVTSAT